jgi:hypothetical protein
VLLYFAACSAVSFAIVFTYLFTSPNPTHEQAFLDGLIDWVKNGFAMFSTNDFAIYAVGVATFVAVPVIGYGMLLLRNVLSHEIAVSVLYGVLSLLAGVLGYLVYSAAHSGILTQTVSSFLSRTAPEFRLYPLLPAATLGVIVLSLLIATNGGSVPSALRERLSSGFARTSRFRTAFTVMFLCVVVALMFNPRYNATYESITKYGGEAVHQFHHVNFFLGPINEVYRGKSMMVDARAQYGLLNTYIPAAIFGVTGISYGAYTFYAMALCIVFALLMFLLLKRVTGSVILAALGVLGYLNIVFFRTNWAYEPYVLPSSTPVRHIFDIVVALALLWYVRNRTSRASWVASAAVAVAFFYNMEIGVSVFLSYIAALVTIPVGTLLQRKRPEREDWMPFLRLGTAVVAGVAVISLGILVRAGQWPDWYGFVASSLFYGKGFIDTFMPVVGPYWFTLAVYVLSGYYVMYQLWIGMRRDREVISFLTAYGVASFVYYINFSEPHHLWTIFHPAILLSIILVSHVLGSVSVWKRQPFVVRTVAAFGVVGTVAFLLWTPSSFASRVGQKLEARYGPEPANMKDWNYAGVHLRMADDDGSAFRVAAETIRELQPDTRDVAILSRYDTILLLMSGKASATGFSIIEYEVFTLDQLKEAQTRIRKERPRYVYVTADDPRYTYTATHTVTWVWDAVKDLYTFDRHAGVVDVYRLK